jgi:SPP1 family predicted phage head-tail adaptor
VKAGELDRRVTIEEYTETQDDYGEPIKDWVAVATVWAQVQPLRGSERFLAQQVSADVETRFRIRWRDDVTDKMRLLYETAYYNITAILEIGRHEGLEIMAKAFVPVEAD